MAKLKFEDILEECLDRLNGGESVEACLKRFPDVESELAPLLRLAQSTSRTASSLATSPEVKEAAWRRLARAWQEQPRKAAMVPRLLLRPLPAALLILVALFLGGWGTVAAAAGSVPGERLYPVKMAREKVEVALISSGDGKARRYAQQAQERGREMEVLTKRGINESAFTALAQQSMQRASQAVLMVQEGPPPAVVLMTPPGRVEPSWLERERTRREVRFLLLQHLRRQVLIRQQLLQQLPTGRREEMEQMLKETDRRLQQLIKQLEREVTQPERLPLKRPRDVRGLPGPA